MRSTLQRVHKLPKHVITWMEDNEDVLMYMYDQLNVITEKTPWVFDKADFCSFCACIARLSTIDSVKYPHGLCGGRRLVHDYMHVGRSTRADKEISTHHAVHLRSRKPEVKEDDLFDNSLTEEEDQQRFDAQLLRSQR